MVGKVVGNLTLWVLDVRVAPAIRGKKLPSPSKPCNENKYTELSSIWSCKQDVNLAVV